MSARGYEPGPEVTILRLFELVEAYFASKGLDKQRRDVTEMRSELGDRLIRRELYGG